MGIKSEIGNRVNDFLFLCKNNDIKYLYAFGSAISNDFDHKNSDIDLLVELNNNDPIIKGETLIRLWDQFEDFFQKKVDLLTESSIKNPILKKNIDQSKVLIYDGKGQKILI